MPLPPPFLILDIHTYLRNPASVPAQVPHRRQRRGNQTPYDRTTNDQTSRRTKNNRTSKRSTNTNERTDVEEDDGVCASAGKVPRRYQQRGNQTTDPGQQTMNDPRRQTMNDPGQRTTNRMTKRMTVTIHNVVTVQGLCQCRCHAMWQPNDRMTNDA
ncbi:hypothetical protein K443DRAFT_4173 [Laccaria amethystina LaAM-08-1]|uniref:Uncharacterized protein n=1 Tax=Laccaria amethystina LaAM-08-1 TaxID=1095629 RepID=A0A0C9WYX3_9AGAR|nr:hypothetical protein K443DRAFT_4173 [Laccaria amethystina LaAM-08-1]